MPPVSWHSGLQLRVVEGPGLDLVTDLGQPRLAVGRSRGAPGERAPGWVFLEDRSVSRQHAELVWDDDHNTYRLLHLSQTNLTWVNGDPVTDRRLQLGDRIKIGPVQLLLEKVPVKAPEKPPEPPPERPPSVEKPRPASIVIPPLKKDTLMLSVGDKSIALDGHFITIGRDNQQLEPTEEDPRVFDLLIELGDPDLHPNHLILKTLEGGGGFEVFRHPNVPPVLVQRTADGLHWEAWLIDQPAHLRAGDSVTLGSTTLRLARQEDAAPVGPRRVTL